MRSSRGLGSGTDAQLLEAAERYTVANAALQAALTHCGATNIASASNGGLHPNIV